MHIIRKDRNCEDFQKDRDVHAEWMDRVNFVLEQAMR